MTTTATPSANDKLLALAAMHCRTAGSKLSTAEIQDYVAVLPGWVHVDDRIEKTYKFANYYETLAFVNALAFIAHREDHHPDLGVHYGRCTVAWSTHSAGGITLNDVICAAKVEGLRL